MRLHWFLAVLAALFLWGAFWITSEGRKVSPRGLLEEAEAALALEPPDRAAALRVLSEALALAQGPEWDELRAEILRTRAVVYTKQGLDELALDDCRAVLGEFGEHADTLALASETCLALDQRGAALEFAQRLAVVDPGRGQTLVGRSLVALADTPLAALDAFARSVLSPSAADQTAALAQRAAVYAEDGATGVAALGELLQHFEGDDDRLRASEWVYEAGDHLRAARRAFVESIESGSTGEAVAGLQELLLRGGSVREAADLGQVALSLAELEDPMPVLARTCSALAALGRHDVARGLIVDLRERDGAAIQPDQLPSLTLRNELAEWCLLLEDLALWPELAGAAWELSGRAKRGGPLDELAQFLLAISDIARNNLWMAEQRLVALGMRPVDQHGIPVLAWLGRAAIARRQRSEPQERYALLQATKAAANDPPRELRTAIGRAWERLSELHESDGDLLAAETSLTHAIACLSEDGDRLLPRWQELGEKLGTTSGVSNPYALYQRARGQAERGIHQPALVDAESLLIEYPGFGPALEVVSLAAGGLRAYPRLITASLEQMERGWEPGEASSRLREIPVESFLPQDRVRWLLLDPRGSLGQVVRRLLAEGDLEGAAQAARGGPFEEQPRELLPLLARVLFDAGKAELAQEALALVPPASDEFRGVAGLALLVALQRTHETGNEELLDDCVRFVLDSGASRDPELVRALDLLVADGRRVHVAALLAGLLPELPPTLPELLLRGTAARLATGEAPVLDEDLERAAGLLEDGRPELGRLLLVHETLDANVFQREVRAALATPLAEDPVQHAVLLLLAGEVDEASATAGGLARDGRDELLAALDRALAEPPRDDGLLPAARTALLRSLAARHPPWSAWVLATAPPASDHPTASLERRAAAWLALGEPRAALEELAPRGKLGPGDAAVAWLRVRALRASGASEEERLAAELRWYALCGRTPANDLALAPLEAETRVASGDREGAVRLLEQVLQRLPGDPRILAALAELEDVPGRRGRAIELHVQLLEALTPAESMDETLRLLDVLRTAREEGEISETRWWAEVEALEALRPLDPAPVRELVERTLETSHPEPALGRLHAIQRLERFRLRSMNRGLEQLRRGEVGRWTDLFARFSPDRAVAFAEKELMRDPGDPALWRASARALLAAGNWQAAIERLEALQSVAPERETARLLAVTSYQIEGDRTQLGARLRAIARFDEGVAQDPLLSFYRRIAAVRGEQPLPGAQKALEQWTKRDQNGLADSANGRALALRLYALGERESALAVLGDTRALAATELEGDVVLALRTLVASSDEPPREVPVDQVPPLQADWAFGDIERKSLAQEGKRGKAGGGKAGKRPKADGDGNLK